MIDIKKTKAMWLGNLANQKDQPLNLTWVKNPTRIIGVLFSYDTQGNNKHNFDIKIQKLQTNLDMWRARDSTLFGKVLRWIPLNVRAISAKNIYQKTTHSTITFSMLFETSHFNSLLQVTP